jgi:hypothetical protein
MSRTAGLSASLSTFLMLAALPTEAGLPSTDKALPGNNEEANYILTNAQTRVGGCTKEALQGPHQLHSAYISGRIAIHENDKHKVKNKSELRKLLNEFEPILKHAWTTEGSLNLSYRQFGNFEEDPQTGNPFFNAKFNIDNEVRERMDHAAEIAENKFARIHGIGVDVKSVRFKNLKPGCGF